MPKPKGFKHSEETLRKMSETHRIRHAMRSQSKKKNVAKKIRRSLLEHVLRDGDANIFRVTQNKRWECHRLALPRHPGLLPIGTRVKCVSRGLTGVVELGRWPSDYFLAVRIDGTGEVGHCYPPHWECDDDPPKKIPPNGNGECGPDAQGFHPALSIPTLVTNEV